MFKKCFGIADRTESELRQKLENFKEANRHLEVEKHQLIEKHKKEENKNNKLEITVSELQQQCNVTNKYYEEQALLIEDLKKNLTKYEIRVNWQNTTIENLVRELEEKDETHNLKLKHSMETLQIYQAKCIKFQEDFNCLEEKLNRIKKLIEPELFPTTLKSQTKQISISHNDLSENNLKRFESKKNKSLTNLKDFKLQPYEDKQTNNQQLFDKIYEILYEGNQQLENKSTYNEETNIEQAIIDLEQFNKTLSLENLTEQTEIANQDLHLNKLLNTINEIHDDITKLAEEINVFSGTKEDKVYLHLKEMLVRNIMKLDNIDTEGRQIIREKRKDVIQFIQQLHKELNNKVLVFENESVVTNNTVSELSNLF